MFDVLLYFYLYLLYVYMFVAWCGLALKHMFEARLLCMEATTDGLAKFQLPVTSVQSMLCFTHGVKSGFNVPVYVASLVPISGSKESKDPSEGTFGNLFQCTNSTKVCVIKKTAPPRAYKKRVQSKKDESEEQCDECTDAEEEARAAEVYDQGCSVAYVNSDLAAPQFTASEEQVANNHDATLQKDILDAKKDGRIPTEVKIRLMSSSAFSFYTDDELERMAVVTEIK